MSSMKIAGIDIKYITVVLVVLVVGGAALVALGGDDDADDSSQQTATTSETPTSPQESTSQPAEGVNAPENVEETQLVAVGDYTGSGTATRSYENGVFDHEVVATLDDPAEGKFYEGWLVGDSIVSTGMLESEGDGEWSLVFSAERDLSEHDEVVITEETLADGLDGNPEDHVLEGSF